ncbi:hypothetical protein, partial [Micrococcus luteus]|uniref:hypothetical protein n=1 Tax=Micrococcus luteus TaxID=1270 RepID=UPI001C92D894
VGGEEVVVGGVGRVDGVEGGVGEEEVGGVDEGGDVGEEEGEEEGGDVVGVEVLVVKGLGGMGMGWGMVR